MTTTEPDNLNQQPMPEMDERSFYELVLKFRDDFFKSVDYDVKRAKHRKPKAYLNEVLQSSFDRLAEIGRREEMRDVSVKDGVTIQGYASSRIKWLVEENRGFNLYNAIKEYCRLAEKDFFSIALLMAEHRGMIKVKDKIRVDMNKLDRKPGANTIRTSRFAGGDQNKTFTDYIDVTSLRSKVMDKFYYPLFLKTLWETQSKIGERLSSIYDVMQATQNHREFIDARETIEKIISIDNSVLGTINATQLVSRILDFKPVIYPERIDRYINILDVLANYGRPEHIPNNTVEERLLLELDYDLSNFQEETKDEQTEAPSQIILLNEAVNIREVILDIYKNHHRLLDVTSRQFEELIAELLSSQGFSVELTKQTRDGGYDIIAISSMVNQAPQKWLVECKRLSSKKVGIEVVRSFKEVVEATHVNRGIIATTSYFSADAMRKQRETPYLLDFRDKDAVMNWIYEYGRQHR